MDRILHTGTVVEAHSGKFLILGASLAEKDGKASVFYRAVGYPKGFAGAESLGWLSPEDITGICAEGYEDEEARSYYERADAMLERLAGLSSEEAVKSVERQTEAWNAAFWKQNKTEES